MRQIGSLFLGELQTMVPIEDESADGREKIEISLAPFLQHHQP